MEKNILDQFTDRVLKEAARCFDLQPEALELISDVENFVYESSSTENPRILRITHSSHRSLDAIYGELEWMEYLSDHGVSVSQPCLSTGRQLVEVISDNHSHFLVTAFQKIPGKTILDSGECAPEIYEQWGQLLGRMHALAKCYQPSNPAYKRPEWFADDLFCNAQTYIPGQAIVLDRLYKLMDRLHTLPKESDAYGLIHADFSDVNFFVHDHQITVFDFDDCQYHWFVYDFAVILYDSLPWLPHAEMNQGAFLHYFWEYFIRGYSKENSLQPYWFNKLMEFTKLREIYLYLVCHKKWDLDNLSPSRTDYLRGLKCNIENDVPYLNLRSLFA